MDVKVEESYWQPDQGYNRSNIELQFLLCQGFDIEKALRAHGLAKEMQQESMQKVTPRPDRVRYPAAKSHEFVKKPLKNLEQQFQVTFPNTPLVDYYNLFL